MNIQQHLFVQNSKNGRFPFCPPLVYQILLSDSCNDGDSNAKDTWGDGCDWYEKMPQACGKYDDADFFANAMCCVCKGYIK